MNDLLAVLIGLMTGAAMSVAVSCVWVVLLIPARVQDRLQAASPRLLTAAMAAGLLLSALGNALDRLVYGYVIDMIELQFIDFYIFNLADVGVVCGAILCGISLLFRPQDWSNK